MTTATAFSVPGSSLGWWHERFKQLGIDVDARRSRDEDEVLTFRDPDGIVIDLVASDGDHRSGWDGVADIPGRACGPRPARDHPCRSGSSTRRPRC